MKKILTFLLASFFCQFLTAQYTYNTAFFQDVGNPGGVNSESDAPGQGTWVDIVDGPQATNIWSPATAIPFPFDFYGNPVTHFKASQNGVVTFDTTVVALPGANENLPSANLPDTTICFWDEFTATPSTGSGDDIRINTFGTAPNRQFWIKWYSFEMGNPTVSFSYFAIVLEETTNKIYIVDQYSNSSVFLSATVGVQLNGATAVQFGSDNTPNAGNGSSNTDNDYWEFDPVLLVNDNAGVISLDNPPTPLSPGMQSVDVTIENFGLNTLNNVNVDWEVNGVPQGSVPYAGALGTNATASVNLGMYNFPSGITNIKAWTSSPNGNTDNDPSNDTLEVSLCTSLSGPYTIGGVSPDFNTLADAVSLLENCGISGPVTFTFAPGTYAGGVEIGPINGASSVNTITFDGVDTTLVTVTHSGSAPNSVFFLNGADYITITNMTIENTGTNDAWGVRLASSADWNTISNNRFLLSQTTTTDVSAVVASNSATSPFTSGINASHTRVLNNYITGGDDAILFYGTTTIGDNSDNHVIGNTILFAYTYGIYLNDQDSVVINNNTISDIRSTFGDGIYSFDLMNFTIMGNNINVPDYGIYIADGNFDGTPVDRGRVINNMVISTSDYGMYFDDFESTDIFHNTSFGKPGIRINDFTALDIRNNIFVGTLNDYAYETDETSAGEVVDFNIYYVTPGNTLFVKDGSSTYTDLASWQAGVGTLNGSSLEGDPLFVDPANDLHIIGTLPNDVGDNSVGVAMDIDGDMRPLAPATIVDIGADEFNPPGDDAGVTALVSPVAPFGAGAQNVDVTIFNYGLNALNTVNIEWTLNGVPQTPLGFGGPAIASGNSGNVSLGVANFPPGTSDLVFWTSFPNGATDEDASNDTLSISVCTSLAGAYTIGGPTPDFADLAQAVDQLNECGVSAPVTITFAPGTYTGGVEIGSINGASSVNTITFDGVDTTLVTVTHTGANPNSVFFLNGADYVTITNMTIENTGTNDAWGVRLANSADWNTISNNRFLLSQTTTTDVSAVVASNSATSPFTSGINASHTRVLNNYITGGDDAILFYGTTTIGDNSDNHVIGNTILFAYTYAIYYNDQDSAVINNNTISDIRSTFGDGIYTFDLMNFTIMGNNINVPDYGIYVSDGNFDGTPIDRGRVINNMVISTSDYGMYFDDFESTDIFHNTSFGKPGIRINDFTALDIRNNIFVGTLNDYAFETDETAGGEVVDYNLYYVTPGNTLFVKDGSSTYGDLASWQAAAGTLNASSLEGDPIFVDPANDLHVLGALPNDVGDNSVGVMMDIDGDARPQAPSTTVDIGADEFTPLANDALVTGMITPLAGCGDSTTNLSFTVQNLGTNTITSLTLSAIVTGDLTVAITGNIPVNIAFGETDTIDLANINTFNGGTYNLVVYTSLPGDEDMSNDTMNFTITRLPSSPPTGTFEPVCEGDSTYLVGMANGGNIAWYDSLTGGNLLAVGDTFWTPALSGNTSYFVGFANAQDSLTTTFAAGNGCGGGNMFDVTANDSLIINGFSVSPNSSAGTADSLSIWYIADGTYLGNETTQGAWTFHEGVSFTSQGDGSILFVGLANTLNIPPGATYAIYVELDANYTSLSSTYSNNDLTITTGAGLCSSFGGVNPGRTFNGTIHYETIPCTNERTEVVVVVDTASLAGFGFSSNEFVATFSDSSTAGTDSVLYDFGDGNFSTDPNPVHTYADTGTYTVCQIAYSTCGPDTLCQTVVITCTPSVAGFGVSSVELVATFSDSSASADSVLYQFGDGTTSTDPNPVHTYASAGMYTVCQITYSECVNDTVCQVLTITCTPAGAGFTVTSTELTATFVDTSSTADSVLYDFGDGNSSTDPNAVHTYASAGTYTVCQIAYNVCENDTVCEEITITCTEPVASFAATTFNGLDITFSDSSANADSVRYDFGDGTTSNETDPTHTYSASGIYTVCQIAYNLCTPDTTCIDISVIATGIDDIPGLSTLNIYPNPNNGVFQIEVGVDFSSELTFEVLTIRGKEIYKQEFGMINGTVREGIDLQNLSKGVYFMRFTLDGQSVTRKLVID